MRIVSVLAAAAVLAMPASAVTLFSQNFDTAPVRNNTTNVPGFTVTGGVDLIRSGTAGVRCTGSVGRCLDLVGSPNVGSVLSSPILFNAGSLVTVSFDVSGNPRGLADTFNFALSFTNPENILAFTLISGFQGVYGGTGARISTFGTYAQSLVRNRPFVGYMLSFIPASSGALRLQFAGSGPNDFAGPILDNVLVTSQIVPEPANWLMLIAGFGMVGVAARRRRSTMAA